MIREPITIVNKLGLHARAAAKFVTEASRYQSDVHLLRNTQKVNGKSIMGVMMLAAGQGTELEIEIEGADESDAFDALEALVADKFGEGE